MTITITWLWLPIIITLLCFLFLVLYSAIADDRYAIGCFFMSIPALFISMVSWIVYALFLV